MSNDGVDVRMSDGRLFHARGPATANARSPMVERRVEELRQRLIETKHHYIQKYGGLEQNMGGGLEPLSPIASGAPLTLSDL